jgi:hypothetical protein
MSGARWLLPWFLLPLACNGDASEPLKKRLPPAVTKAEPTAVPLAGRLTIARVIDDDPLLSDLPEIVGADDLATGAGVHVEEDVWTHAGSGQEHRVPFLEASDRAALASYVGALLQRKPELRPAEGHRFAYEEVRRDPSGKLAWRTYLIDRTRAISPSEAESIELRENPVGHSELLVEFNDEDGAAFSDLTEDSVGHKLAILVGQRVVSAPVVLERIPGNAVVITPGTANDPAASKAEAERWLAELRGE